MGAKGGKRPGAGRPKGATNKELRPLREAVNLLIDDQWELLKANLEKLSENSPAAHVNACLSLLEFCLPKLARVEQRNITTIEHLLNLDPVERRKKILELKQSLENED